MTHSRRPLETNSRRVLRSRWGVVFVTSLLIATAVRASEDPCPAYGTGVVVDVHDRAMWLCTAGAPLAHYQVALGRGGTGKRVRGDRKTPLGRYPLGEPRRSARFGVFIPVSYPTAEQRSRGFTGGQIGIHGPLRRFEAAGPANTFVDWTDGCIALGTIEEAMKVATFVRKHAPSVFIR